MNDRTEKAVVRKNMSYSTDFDNRYASENGIEAITKNALSGADGSKNDLHKAFDSEKFINEKEKNIENAFFLNPKKVKKKTQKNILIFQIFLCGAVCILMLICKISASQLYENLHFYFMRFFGC